MNTKENWKERLRIAWLLSAGDPKDFRPIEETVTQILEKLISDMPATPEHWDSWSIERQLGYNMCWFDIKNHLRKNWLGEDSHDYDGHDTKHCPAFVGNGPCDCRKDSHG